jgi:hypothetical protein
MPVSERDDIRVSGQRIPHVFWTWGMDFPPERRWTDGWGSTIEAPAVIELLDLIAAGTVDATAARRAIAAQAAALDAKYDPDHGNEAAQKRARCFGDCEICQAAEPAFRRARAESEARVAKARDHANYPYIIHGQTAHLATCHHAAAQHWYSKPLSDDEFRHQLKWHAHDERTSLYRGEPVDWDGLVRWAEANTGPQGGRHYRACKACKPPVP